MDNLYKAPLRNVLDIRGLALHAYHSGTDVSPIRTIQKSADGTDMKVDINSAAHGLKTFIELYLRGILQRCAPIDIIAVWEGGNQRRRGLFPGYKSKPSQQDANPAMKEEIEKLFHGVKQLLAGLGAIQMEVPTNEADDVIAYLCQRLKGAKIVHTVDQDLLALGVLYPDVLVLVKHKHLTTFKGHPINMVTLYKSIVGDDSDTYPGVMGIGEKTFDKMVEVYGYDGMAELETCIKTGDFAVLHQAYAETKDPTLKKLIDKRDQWGLSYILATLHPEWCELSFEEKVIRPRWYKRLPSRERVTAALVGVGLTDRIPSFLEKFMPTMTLMDSRELATTDMAEILKQAKAGPIVAFDYESYDSLKHPEYQEVRAGYVDVLSQRVTGVSYCYGNNLQHSFYMPMKHADTYNVSEEQFVSTLETMLGETLPVAQNCKFEQVLSKVNFGIEFDIVMDTAIMASYVDEEMEHGLKMMSKKWLNYDQTTYDQVIPKGQDMRDISGDQVLQYGADDSVTTAHLYVLYAIILELEQTFDFVYEEETSFDFVMMDSFITGMPVDLDRLKELSDEDDELYDKTMTSLRSALSEHCSEYNHKGFETLWDDWEDFARNKEAEAADEYIKKILDEEFPTNDVALHPIIAERRIQLSLERAEWFKLSLEEKREAVFQASRFVPLSAPEHMFKPFRVSAVSAASKTVGLASIRANKAPKVLEWIAGIREQAEAQSITFTSRQELFLTLLTEACEFGNILLSDRLQSYCRELVFSNTEYFVGDELNVDSPLQMAQLMYAKMGLPILIRNEDKTGKTARTRYDMVGAPGTSRVAIETNQAELAEDSWQHRVLADVLVLRGINTRRELYYRPYPLWISPVDGMIHPGIRNCGTKTRRPSGSSPNILQVSKQDGAKIREIILPLPDSMYNEPQVIVSIDFVQQELVILAGESGDPTLRSCYVGDNQKDVHSLTASGLMGISYEEFLERLESPDPYLKDEAKFYRGNRRAKPTNFLMAYGGSAAGLSRKAVMPRQQADEALAAYYDTYPLVKQYQENKAYEARRYGFVKDCFGIRKHCAQVFSSNSRVRNAIERQAGNAPIQGGAASALKRVMKRVRKERIRELTRATLLAPVYDEVVASVPVSSVVDYIRKMENAMEMELPGLNISLTTSVSFGLNWGQASMNEMGKRPSNELIVMELDKLFHPEKYVKPDRDNPGKYLKLNRAECMALYYAESAA